MSAGVGRVVGAALRLDNRLIRRVDGVRPNPRPVEAEPWHGGITAAWPALRAEWDAFVASGGRLPRIEQVLVEDQGNEGSWRLGLLVADGRPVPVLAEQFPVAIATVLQIPGLRSAMWSELDAGAEIPTHRGPNAGVLRYHLGVRCGDDAGLEVDGVVVQYRDGHGVLFDDTAPHAAWNRGRAPRVTLFCELVKPLPPPVSWCNDAVQAVLLRDERYRRAPERAQEWHRALNHWDSTPRAGHDGRRVEAS